MLAGRVFKTGEKTVLPLMNKLSRIVNKDGFVISIILFLLLRCVLSINKGSCKRN